jgi:DNA invertase Pin-like site-specific DNA recombinase
VPKDSAKSQKAVSELSVIKKEKKAMIYGYARVSTATQGRDGNSLEDQVAALEKYGCQKIIQETFTGKTMDRPKFLRLLEELQEGDTLVVCKLDRFARTAIEGVQVVRELFERGVRVHILNMGLVENTLTGNLILTVMLAFAEYERGTIVERTQTGKAVARLDPSFKDGRPKKFTPEQIQLALSLLEEGKTYRQITTMTGISKSTLIRARRV